MIAPSVMIAAGEASGDQHAAAVAKRLLEIKPAIQLFGMGSTRLRSLGVELLVDAAPLAVVGLSEVIAHYPALQRALNLLRKALKERKPDLLILVDNPEFNLKLAKTARSLGIRVLYYVSPQIWAWRQGRVKKIAKRVDKMAVVFPFEEAFYRRAGVDVSFVGHPLLDELPEKKSATEPRQLLGLGADSKIIGLFPGSRKSEIRRILPVLAQTAEALSKKRPELQFILPVAATIDADEIRALLGNATAHITLMEHRDIYDVISACDAIAATSGTVTLQIALSGVPLAVVYRVSSFTYQIGKRLIKIPFIGLPNIVAGKLIVKEFVQNMATPEAISVELLRLLDDNAYAAHMKRDMKKLKSALGKGGASFAVARLAIDLLKS